MTVSAECCGAEFPCFSDAVVAGVPGSWAVFAFSSQRGQLGGCLPVAAASLVTVEQFPVSFKLFCCFHCR